MSLLRLPRRECAGQSAKSGAIPRREMDPQEITQRMAEFEAARQEREQQALQVVVRVGVRLVVGGFAVLIIE